MNKILQYGLNTVDSEIEALKTVRKKLGSNFEDAVNTIFNSKGKLVITGIGKSGIIAKKIASTLTSTGTPTYYLDPAESMHGDLGILLKDDVIIALSKSGESEEIIKLIPHIKRINVPLISITSKPKSILGKNSDVIIDMGIDDEACPLNLAPTSSTTAQLVIGDAIAVALLKMRNFTEKDYALIHPGGLLGKKLLKIKDIMHTGDDLPVVEENTTMKEVITTIIDKRLGVAITIDKNKKLSGIIVDGDLKRILLKSEHILDKKASEFSIKNPTTIGQDELIAKALNLMEGRITSLIVKNEKDEPVGLIHIHDILKSGVY